MENEIMNWKKFLALLLCLVMIGTMLPATVLAEAEEPEPISETMVETEMLDSDEITPREYPEDQVTTVQEPSDEKTIDYPVALDLEPDSEMDEDPLYESMHDEKFSRAEENGCGITEEDAVPLQETPEEAATEEDNTFLLADIEESENSESAEPESEPSNPKGENAFTGVRINPLYSNLISEDDLVQNKAADFLTADALADDVQYYETLEDAAVYLKNCMKRKEQVITIPFYAPSFSMYSCDELLDLAVQHTGVPTEGDYLYYQLSGWRVSVMDCSSGYHSASDTSPRAYQISYTMTYNTTAEQEDEVDVTLSELLNSLQLEGKSDYQKVLTIYRYITDNVSYDYDNLYNTAYTLKFSAYAALINHKAVCQGYASLLYRMLLTAGIDCRAISGKGNGGDHAWNIVRIGSLYYNVDSTWDTGGEFRWFLLNDEDFTLHVRENKYASEDFYSIYPMSGTSYTPEISEQTVVVVWSWDSSYTYATANFYDEQTHHLLDSVEATAKVHIIEKAGCETLGSASYTARVEYRGNVYTDTKTVMLPATGHSLGDAVRENEVPATCRAEGSYDEVWYCTVCGEETSRITKTVEKLPHTYGDAVRENEMAATCTAEGSYDEVWYCAVCGEELCRNARTVDKLSHKPGVVVRRNETASTCTEEGSYDEVVCCSACGEELSRETKTIEKLAHTPGDAVRENEVAASCTAEGSYDEVVYCSECKEELSRETKTIEALGHDFVDGVCSRCGEKETTQPEFEDVADPTAYYFKPVYWAAGQGITSGTSPTTFSPGKPCTRGQIVTFLWKAMGSPEPSSTNNPFTDVKESDYFYNPVLWAKENGVTSGKTATTFEPGSPCTRGQIVTFLWIAKGRPEPTATDNPFTDVKTNDYFNKAVLWAKENKITSGTSETTFSPGKTCTRAQAMTFLWIASGRPER